jgi:uncharacterized protein
MNKIEERFRIESPPEDVWPLLSDPLVVASCIPGAMLVKMDEGETYQGTMAVKFGPTAAVFKGQVTLDYDDAERVCRIEGRGKDQRGGNASASGVVRVSGDVVTEVSVNGTFHVTGPLAVFARTGGVHVARALLADFSKNLEAMLVRPGAATESPTGRGADAVRPLDASTAQSGLPSGAEQRIRSLSGFSLLWRSFLGWLKGLRNSP